MDKIKVAAVLVLFLAGGCEMTSGAAKIVE